MKKKIKGNKSKRHCFNLSGNDLVLENGSLHWLEYPDELFAPAITCGIIATPKQIDQILARAEWEEKLPKCLEKLDGESLIWFRNFLQVGCVSLPFKQLRKLAAISRRQRQK